MSVAERIAERITQLTSIRTAIRTALTAKGVTDAGTHNFADFADDIGSIQTGVTPTGQISITENGTYDVTDKASAVVNVSDEDPEMISSYVTSTRYYQTPSGYWIIPTEQASHGRLLNKDKSNFIFNPASATTSWKIVSKFKMITDNASSYPCIWGSSEFGSTNGAYGSNCYFNGSRQIVSTVMTSNGDKRLTIPTVISINQWYFVSLSYNVSNNFLTAALYNEDGSLIDSATISVTNISANTGNYQCFGGRTNGGVNLKGEVDLASTVYMIDGICVWGETNSKTQNIGTTI